MRIRCRVFIVPSLILLAGCAETVFTEVDEGRTREVSRGSVFSISLPAVQSTPRPAPKIEEGYVRLLERRIEGTPPREVFRFSADGLGEIELRFYSSVAPQGKPELDYVLRVRVRPDSPGAATLSQPGPKSSPY